jgi:hypothetical protein
VSRCGKENRKKLGREVTRRGHGALLVIACCVKLFVRL